MFSWIFSEDFGVAIPKHPYVKNIHQRKIIDTHTSPGRHDCLSLPNKNRRHPEQASPRHQQNYLTVSIIQTDHHYCRLGTLQIESEDGLGVKGIDKRREETFVTDISQDHKSTGRTKNRPVSIETIQSTTTA